MEVRPWLTLCKRPQKRADRNLDIDISGCTPFSAIDPATPEMGCRGMILLLVVIVGVTVSEVTGIYVVESGGKKSFVRLGAHHWTDGSEDDGLWSSLLEEYTVG
uniref:Uncharacterized protein n=1 Tax=Anopheles maculatus TaxID=74869 RepID=A0A182SW45_9DIPT